MAQQTKQASLSYLTTERQATNACPAAQQKRPYLSPSFVQYGAIAKLTHKNSPRDDGGIPGAMSMST